LLDLPKASKTLRQDVLVAGLVGEVHRLLRTAFFQEQVLFRKLHVMSTRQITETFSLLALLPCPVGEVTHLLIIGNRRIILTQQVPDAPTPFVDGQQVRLVHRSRNALADL
jgi:hypothetical protein